MALMKSLCRSVCFLFLTMCIVTCCGILPPVDAESEPPARNFSHAPVYSALAGRDVAVSVTFAEPGEIAEIRLYFRVMGDSEYLFLPMILSGDKTYSANLPPAKNWTEGIDYLLLRKSTTGEIRKTKPFRLLVQNDYNPVSPTAKEILVQTEQKYSPAENLDFAVPLRVTVTTDPLLEQAEEDPYPPVSVPGPGGRSSSGILGGLGGVSFSIKAGGIAFSYRSFSGR